MLTRPPVCRFWWLAPLLLLSLLLGKGAGEDNTKAPPTPAQTLVNLKEKNLLLDFNAEEGSEKNILWQQKLGKISYAGPVVAGGKVYVATNNDNPRDPAVTGDHGVLMCFDAKSGKFLWQATHEVLEDEAQNNRKLGIGSTPFVEGDRLYYVSNRCELVCADVNGDPKNPGKARFHWKLDMIKDLKVFPSQLAATSPLVVGDMVYVVTGNGQDVSQNPWKLPSPDAPSFIGVRKSDGKVVWTSKLPGKNIMEGQWTNPAYANPKKGKPQVIFPGGDGWLYALNPKDGELIWKFYCNPKDAVYNHANKRISEKCYFIATPVVWEDRCYIGIGANPEDGSGPGHFFCLDITKNGDVSVKTDDFDPKDPKNKDSALIWHYGGKIKPPPERGRDVRFGRTMSTCAIHDGLLYIPELDGFFHCFDARTGERLWVHDMRVSVWSSPYLVDNKILVGNDDGDLLIFEQGRQAKKPKAYTFGPPIKTPVQVVDGVIYVMTHWSLYAIGKK